MARRRHERTPLNAEINVVSLIDVMLLLLVIFMLTAPMMTSGLDVDLPQFDAKPIESKSGLTITLKRDGGIYIDETRLGSFDQFRAAFPSFVAGKERLGVNIAGDRDITLEQLTRVFAVVRAAGVSTTGLLGMPEEIGR
jgi:biopolymer transport protein ExbD